MRAFLGPEDEDQKDEVLLGRFVRWRSCGIEWEAYVKHQKLLLERFGLDGNAMALSVNGDWGDWVSTAGEDQDTDVFPDEANEFRAASREIETTWVRILPMFNFLQRSYRRRWPMKASWRRTEEGRPVSCWKKASCVAIPFTVRGGGGPDEGDHGCRLGWR